MTNGLTWSRQFFDRNVVRLFFCGVSALFWELVLIRWFGSCVRIVAYYSNFVLIAAFFGLGVGALLARFSIRLYRLIFPAIGLALLCGIQFSGFIHFNFSSPDEFVWIGAPPGVLLSEYHQIEPFSTFLILGTVYCCTTIVFVFFGQWIGHLFQQRRDSLLAYSVEVAGSIVGIVFFALLSYFQAQPPVWFAVGFVLLLVVIERNWTDLLIGVSCIVVIIALTKPFADKFIWSPYYRIYVQPITQTQVLGTNSAVNFDVPVGYTLTVNNDYHQMVLDLRKKPSEPAFLSAWRFLYDYPYRNMDELPDGPILIVGAGTGNDVSAALRNTRRQVYAVEIDPSIAELGRQLHFEQPYSNARVRLIVTDARSFFQKTDQKYALVVLGFLDSHTLLSSFSSVRLDNYVYTLESFRQIKNILLPGGRVSVTFSGNKLWVHERIFKMLDSVFDFETVTTTDPTGYANGAIYINRKSASAASPPNILKTTTTKNLADDDWPFLYLRTRTIPKHYLAFIVMALVMGLTPLFLLPRGQRKIRFPYFFLGAGFFLIETSNVVSLSLLYGSTWFVAVVVFVGILLLVLAGNLTSHAIAVPRMKIYMLFLVLNVLLAYAVPTAALLAVSNLLLRTAAAVLIFLGPVYFASLIFATLIKDEEKLFQAYGSNILGAVVGGVCEYTSLVFGFKFLLLITLFFYLLVYAFMDARYKHNPPTAR